MGSTPDPLFHRAPEEPGMTAQMRTALARVRGIAIDRLGNRAWAILYSSGRRGGAITAARDAAILHLRESLGLSYPQIADVMEAGSHGTIISRYKRMRPDATGRAKPWRCRA